MINDDDARALLERARETTLHRLPRADQGVQRQKLNLLLGKKLGR